MEVEITDKASSARIAEQLHAEILAGELPPGFRFRQEELAERFGASRLPVRDALRRLEADGLVTIVANTGAWVSKLNEQECADAYQMRERLEPLLLTMSMPNLEAGVVEQMEKLATQMEASDDVEVFLRLDREFHLLSYGGAPRGMVRELIERLWNTTQHYRRAFAQIQGSKIESTTHMEHRLLVDAMRRGDVEAAERVLADHIRRTRISLEAHPEIFD